MFKLIPLLIPTKGIVISITSDPHRFESTKDSQGNHIDCISCPFYKIALQVAFLFEFFYFSNDKCYFERFSV